jgi:hypothetical protein
MTRVPLSGEIDPATVDRAVTVRRPVEPREEPFAQRVAPRTAKPTVAIAAESSA